MTQTVVTVPDGINLPLESLAQTLGYTGSNLTTITVTYNAKNYVQTLTYSGSNVTNVSAWTLT
jgi:hypothetical protein